MQVYFILKQYRPCILRDSSCSTWKGYCSISNSYTMACPPVRGDNPRALASGLSYVQVDKHGITILYHLHQCRPCSSRDISCSTWKGYRSIRIFIEVLSRDAV